MNSTDSSAADQKFLTNSMASFIRIGALLILLYLCFTIVSPFLAIVIWAVIISVAVYPGHVSLTARLGGLEKSSAMILILAGLLIIVVPTWILGDSTIDGLRFIAAEFEEGTPQIPPPDASVAEWPVIGTRVHELWSAAATNLEATLHQFQPQLQSLGRQAMAFAGHTVGTVFLFVFSVIVAGVLLTTAASSYTVASKIAESVVGVDYGKSLTDLSIGTVRSVAKGVLGVAMIQAVLSAIGLLVAGVPGAGIWAGAVLVLAIIQLPPLLVLGPIALWYFSVAEPFAALVFLVFAIVVSVSDAFLKPLLLGRGVEIPMLVILIGAIGGAITMGIVGLFVGAVILALGYKLLLAWIMGEDAQTEPGDA